MSKKEKITLTVLIFLALLGAGFLNFHPVSRQTTELNYTDTTPGQMSVYDFMSRLRSEGKINFTEKNYTGLGEFIVSINGLKQNEDLTWIYYVNGKEAQVGISNYKINAGDTVTWKYEKQTF
jgi:hypothetical protein